MATRERTERRIAYLMNFLAASKQKRLVAASEALVAAMTAKDSDHAYVWSVIVHRTALSVMPSLRG